MSLLSWVYVLGIATFSERGSVKDQKEPSNAMSLFLSYLLTMPVSVPPAFIDCIHSSQLAGKQMCPLYNVSAAAFSQLYNVSVPLIFIDKCAAEVVDAKML